MEFDWTQGALAEGLRRYDAGEFFNAHEAWGTVWLQAQEPDKTFLQGLIQVDFETRDFTAVRRSVVPLMCSVFGTPKLIHPELKLSSISM
jgi:predicted metal-dependent hydrolase